MYEEPTELKTTKRKKEKNATEIAEYAEPKQLTAESNPKQKQVVLMKSVKRCIRYHKY